MSEIFNLVQKFLNWMHGWNPWSTDFETEPPGTAMGSLGIWFTASMSSIWQFTKTARNGGLGAQTKCPMSE